MNSRSLLILIFLMYAHAQGLGQELCLKIDRIDIHYVPVNIRTPLSLTREEVVDFDDSMKKYFVESDSSAIEQFCFLYSEGIVLNSHSNSPLDIRIVFDLYNNENIVYTICMNKNGWYMIGNQTIYSDGLFKWATQRVL